VDRILERLGVAGGSYGLDKRRLLTQFSCAAKTYTSASSLQKTTATDLVDRLNLFGIVPALALDLGSATGFVGELLRVRFPSITVVNTDFSKQMASIISKKDHDMYSVVTTAEQLAFGDESIPVVMSNMLLHWCDINEALPEVCRILEIGGIFLFSTLGSETLHELRDSWGRVDDFPHVHEFIDIRDLGDALITAGFSEPVLDVDRHVRTHKDVPQLVAELRRTGSTNVRYDRRRSCTGRHRYDRFVAAYEQLASINGIPSTWEVIYGLATKNRVVTKKEFAVALPDRT